MSDFAEPVHDFPQEQEPLRRAAAAFIGQVLGLNEDTNTLAADLSPIKRDANASIYTIQLDSSVGPAAFLVYGYILDARGGDGRTGGELFDVGLETLQQAAERCAPRPRAVAHADAGEFGFILATTPGTYRALTGSGEPLGPAPVSPLEPMPLPTPTRIHEGGTRRRNQLALDLLRALREANDLASSWLVAIQTPDEDEAPGLGPDGMLQFTEDETELALYLLDDDSISSMLQALNILVSTAQNMTQEAIDGGE